MSASTVANPAVNTRRRTVAVMEKKSSKFERVEEGGGRVSEQVRNEGGRNLSHTIRGETTLDRETYLSSSLQVKKGLVDSTISPRCKKVVSGSPEKPLWRTVLSVFTKNLVLLLVLGGFVQMIRKLALKSGDGVVSSEINGRITEVEKFTGTTTKMMQVQVEVMERKIEREVGGLRREFSKKIEEKGIIYGAELKQLEAKADELGKSFGELKASGILTREDFDRFFDEFKNNADGSEKELSLDDIRVFAKEIVEKEIEKHAADGLGMVDYALASGGGRVLDHSEPFTHTKGSGWLPFKNQYGVHQDAQRVLEPSFGEPGKCFPLQGRNGYVVIKLRTAIIPEAVTVEHVSKSVAYDRSSAPKDCRVSGWYQKHESTADGGADLSRQDEKMFMLSDFVYDLAKTNAQTFKVDSGETWIINTVRFDFDSNHGASHMCIYRLRVHGYEPDSGSYI